MEDLMQSSSDPVILEGMIRRLTLQVANQSQAIANLETRMALLAEKNIMLESLVPKDVDPGPVEGNGDAPDDDSDE